MGTRHVYPSHVGRGAQKRGPPSFKKQEGKKSQE